MRFVTDSRLHSPGRRVIAAGRNFAAFCLAFAAILSMCAPAFAAGSETGGGRTVRVGFFSFDGYYTVDSAGERSGYGYELLQLMATHADISYQYVDDVATWGELEQMLLDGGIDMLTSVQKTPENEARFAFSDTPISTSSTMLTVKSGNTHFIAGDYSTYDGARVGVMRGNSHAEKFANFARKHGFSYTPVYYDSLSAMQAALQAGGDIDACVTSNLRPLHNEWIIEQFDPSPFYMMMRKDDTNLISTVNNALRQMDVYSPNWRTELYNKFYAPDNGSNLLLSSDERDYIAAQKTRVFSVAVDPDNRPYSYFENGIAMGIIPEVFDEIARRAGISYKVVETATRADYEQLVNSGGVDLVMDAGWNYSEAENAGYKLTSSYMSLAVAQISKLDFTGSAKRVAVPGGSLQAQLSASSLFSVYDIVPVSSASDAIAAAASGSCDAAFLYSDTAQQWLADDVRSIFRISLLPGIKVDMAVGALKSNSYLLLSVLSKSAQSVESNYVQETVLKHTSVLQNKLSLMDYLYLNPVWAVGIAVVIAAVAILVVVIVLQRRWYERQRQLNASLRKAKLDAETANEAKSVFLSGMSHDLRTPLNGIVGFTDLAIREDDPAKKQDYLLKIKSSGELLADLVSDTLELSRIESGKMTLQPEAVNCRALGRAIIMAVEPAAELKNVTLLTDAGQYPDENVWVDKMKLQKIMLNLLSNAIKYTPEGGTVRLSVGPLDPPENGCTRRIVVEDSGIGMGAEFLQNIYEPFSQEHRPEAANVAGTGLGLTIVKRIVDLMSGCIRVESVVGRGTKFTVDLPIQRADDAGTAKAQVQDDPTVLAGKRVLLCEDNYLNTEIVSLLLGERGMTVECAADGRADVEKFADSAPGYFDVILMDMRMPIMDGCEAAETIRKLSRTDARAVPIIAVSADAFEDDMRRAYNAGMTGYLSKPIDPNKLSELLQESLK